MKFKTYLVGGSIRDRLLSIPSKDLDFIVVAPSFEAMQQQLIDEGAEVFVSKPEFLTVRCKHPLHGVADFACARADGSYSDARHPDSVAIAASLEQDLARRDFTAGAIAQDMETGELIDPFGGIGDIQSRVLRCVGRAEERFREDSLRLLRAMRFSITKNFELHPDIIECLHTPEIVQLLSAVSEERVYEELRRCFQHHTLRTLEMLEGFRLVRATVFSGRLILLPTLQPKK